MAVIGTATINVGADVSKVGSDIKKGMTRSVLGVGATVAAALGVAGIVRSIGQIGVAYNDQINTFSSLGPTYAAAIDAVRKKSIELGNDLTLPTTSAADAAAAMVELAKGGLSAADAMGAAKGALMLATAGQIDGATAATVLSNALNQYSLSGSDASRVTDVLANTANAASGGVMDIAGALKYIGPVAGAFKISIEDSASAIGLLANNGIKADMAGTSLRGMLGSLAAPSKLGAQGISELGITAFDSTGKFVGMRSVIEQLNTAQEKLTDQQFTSAAALAFGREPLAAVVALAKEGAPGFDAMATAVARQGGAAEVAAAKTKGLGGAFRGLVSQIETIKIDIYNKVQPELEASVRAVSNSVPSFVSGAKAIASGLAGPLSTAFSPLVTAAKAAVQFVQGLTGNIPQNLPKATKPQTLAGYSATTLSLPAIMLPKNVLPPTAAQQIGLDIRKALDKGIGSIDTKKLATKLAEMLVDAIEGLISHSAEIVGAFGRFFAQVAPRIALELGKQTPTIVLGFVTGLLNFDLGGALGFIGEHWGQILLGLISVGLAPTKWIRMLGKIPFVGRILEWLFGGLRTASRSFGRWGMELWNGIGRAFTTHGNRFFSSIGRFMLRLPVDLWYWATRGSEAFSRGIGALPGLAGKALGKLPGTLGFWAGRAIMTFIGVFGRLPGLMLGILVTLAPRASSALAGVGGSLVRRGWEMIYGFLRGMVTGGGGLPGVARTIIGWAISPFTNIGGSLVGWGRSLIGGFSSGISGSWSSVWGAAKGILGYALSPFKGIASLWTEGYNLIAGFAQGIREGAQNVIDAIENWVLSKLPPFIRKYLDSHSPSRVYARIGQSIPEGMALGIRQSAPLVARAAVDALQAAQNAANGYGWDGSMSAAAGNAARAGGSRPVLSDEDVEKLVAALRDAGRSYSVSLPTATHSLTEDDVLTVFRRLEMIP